MKADEATTSDAGTTVASLDGTWQIVQDPKNEGESAGWFKAGAFPLAQAKPAQVPGVPAETFPMRSWDTDPPTDAYWYLRTFATKGQPEAHVRYYLRFAAVKQNSDVWLNGTHLGGHRGGEDPFEFDVTKILQATQDNTLVVRAQMNLLGGIWQPVKLVAQPEVRIIDAFARPDAKAKKIDLEVTLENNSDSPAPVEVAAELGHFKPAAEVGRETTSVTAAPGLSTVKLTLPVANPHLWNLDDPFLYTIKVTSAWKDGGGAVVGRDVDAFRTGFRDFRVVDGFFYLNGKRFYIKCAHGNQYDPLYGLSSSRNMTYLYKELDQLKKAGFNMMRCIVASAMPEQLDYADEHGMLYFTENETSWPEHETPEVVGDPSLFGRTLNQVVRRDRNHPSLVLWGLLNETDTIPVYEKAKAWLPSLRAIDDTRPVLLSSGRWDRDLKTASLSNPGSLTWDTYMGGEDPVGPRPTGVSEDIGGGFKNGTGDAHIYTSFPLNWPTITNFLAIAHDTKPFFLSEAGMGSSFDPLTEGAMMEKLHVPDYVVSWSWIRAGIAGMKHTWSAYGLEGTYPDMHDFIVDSDLSAAKQRAITFSMVRGNPQINGYNLTSIEDFWGAGEGVMNNFRDFKSGHLEMLRAGWAPLRWCLLVNPANVYGGKPLHVRVALANMDVLRAGDHGATLSISGPAGEVWRQPVTAHVQENGPLAYTLFDQDVTIPSLRPGRYSLKAQLEGSDQPVHVAINGTARVEGVGINAAAGRWDFTVTAHEALPKITGSVSVAGVPQAVRDLLTAQGAQLRDFAPHAMFDRETILVGGDFKGAAADWRALYSHVAQGAHAVFLDENAFRLGDAQNQWLAIPEKGTQNTDPEWLYHQDCVAKAGQGIFAGLPVKLMEPLDYGQLLANARFFAGTTVPDDTAAVAIRSTLGNHYEYKDGVMIGTYKLGAGRFTINAFDLAGTVGHPATDRLLVNLVTTAQADAARVTPLPGDFNATLDKLGIVDPPPSSAPAPTPAH
jgi:hypothetical protein